MPGSGYVTEDGLEKWSRIGDRHALRDAYFLRSLEPYFRPGPILELGAATGHLSAILRGRGYDVTASDLSPRFVAAAAARGLKTARVDATRDIVAQTGAAYANVLAQNVAPLYRRDRATVLAALTAIHGALEPQGRLIVIGAVSRRNRRRHFSPREQIELARGSGLFHILRVFPHQVVPPGLYRAWNARGLNVLDHRLAAIASIRLVWIMEKSG